jgi:hypothetical protein
MPTAAEKEIAIVTADELLELAEWEKKFAIAKQRASEAEGELKVRRQALAEKVLGIKSLDELKLMAPERVIQVMTRRFENGHWKPTRNAPEFKFKNTQHGRYPAWSQLFTEQMGETAAARIRMDTPITWSYSVDVTIPA